MVQSNANVSDTGDDTALILDVASNEDLWRKEEAHKETHAHNTRDDAHLEDDQNQDHYDQH